jgi:hypothetical protein
LRAVFLGGAVPVIARLPGPPVIMAVAALDLIVDSSQHASPGRSQYLDNNHVNAATAQTRGVLTFLNGLPEPRPVHRSVRKSGF